MVSRMDSLHLRLLVELSCDALSGAVEGRAHLEIGIGLVPAPTGWRRWPGPADRFAGNR